MDKVLKWVKTNLVKIILFAYTVLVIMVLLFKFPTGMDIFNADRTRFAMQWIPFKTIIEYASQVHSLSDWFIKNLVCNIVMFIPYGFILPYIMKGEKSFLKISIFGIIFSFVIEIVQFIFAIGKFDIDDVILNVAGAMLGYVVYIIFKRKRNINSRRNS